MHRTIFDTPVVNTVLRAFSVGFLKFTGWIIEGALPTGAAKCVLIAAPHTSNWDLPYTLMVAFQVLVLLRVASGGTVSCSGPSAVLMASIEAATRLLDCSRFTGIPPSHIIRPRNGGRKIDSLPIQYTCRRN